MRGLIILANGFEDTEAITTIDILKRGGIDVVSCTINTNKIVTTQYNNVISVEKRLSEINHEEFDFLIIPGGRAVLAVLDENNEVRKAIMTFYNNHKLICAICAAPLLLGKLGLFKDLEYTCFPGTETYVIQGKLSKENVVVNSQFITAKSMFYTIDFALAIIEKVIGVEKRIKVERSIKGII